MDALDAAREEKREAYEKLKGEINPESFRNLASYYTELADTVPLPDSPSDDNNWLPQECENMGQNTEN